MPELHDDVLAHRDWLLSFIHLPPRGTVIDLGCGDGHDLRTLAAMASGVPIRFVGLDASEQAVATARVRSATESRLQFEAYHLGSSLPFADASVDVVYSSNLLECLADPTTFAREIARILHPAGQVVVSHWDWDSQIFDGDNKPRVRRLVHAYADWQQEWMEHADAWMGRRLSGVLNASGYLEGEIHARVLLNTEYSDPWFGFTNAQAMRSLVKRGLADADDVQAFLSEQALLHEQRRYIYSITGYAYVGRPSSST